MIKTFLAVGEDLISEVEDNTQIIDNYVLKKATPEENQLISQRLNSFFKKTRKQELEWVEIESEIIGDRLEDPKKFKYWIVEIYGNTFPNQDFLRANHLSEIDLNFLLRFNSADPEQKKYGVSYHFLEMAAFIESYVLRSEPSKKITQEDIKEIGENYKKLVDFNSKYNDNESYKFIFKSLTNFDKLKAMNYCSPFKNLAIFSIIEFLITYQEKNKEITIAEQIKTNMTLLKGNFKKNIDFKKIFDIKDQTPEDTIIEKLYKYRNNIAHGDIPDFGRKLILLKDEIKIHNALYTFLKRLLIYSLENPDSIKSLRENNQSKSQQKKCSILDAIRSCFCFFRS